MKKEYYLATGLVCIAAILCIAVISLAVLVGGGYTWLRLWQKEWTPQGQTEMRFSKASVDFHHKADLEDSLPFMAAAAIDLDGDGIDEVFIGGGKGQADGILKFNGSRFVNIASQFDFSKDNGDATMGAASLDLENDGLADLIVARESGVWLHMNRPGRGFTHQNLHLPLADNHSTVHRLR